MRYLQEGEVVFFFAKKIAKSLQPASFHTHIYTHTPLYIGEEGTSLLFLSPYFLLTTLHEIINGEQVSDTGLSLSNIQAQSKEKTINYQHPFKYTHKPKLVSMGASCKIIQLFAYVFVYLLTSKITRWNPVHYSTVLVHINFIGSILTRSAHIEDEALVVSYIQLSP